MKALDFVKTPGGAIAIVSETNDCGNEVSINFLGGGNPTGERNAWWMPEELEHVDSLPRLLAVMAAHPYGRGKDDVRVFFEHGIGEL